MKPLIHLKILIILITILSAEVAESQVIINLINNYDIGFQPPSRIEFIKLNISGHGSLFTEILRYNDDFKIVDKKIYNAEELTFSMTWEYDSLSRLVRQTRETKNYFGLDRTITNFHWVDHKKIHAEYVGNSNNILSRSDIYLDSCMNPTKIISYDPDGDVAGREVAQYDYKDNFVEIYIYDKNARLLGITLSNILYKNIDIPFKDYIEQNEWNSFQKKVKNWNEFEVVMFHRDFKFDKNNIWKSYTLERLHFNPSKNEYKNVFNDLTKRKIKYAN